MAKIVGLIEEEREYFGKFSNPEPRSMASVVSSVLVRFFEQNRRISSMFNILEPIVWTRI